MFNFGLNTLQSSYLIDQLKNALSADLFSWLQEKSRNAERRPGSLFQLGTQCWLDVSKSKGRKAFFFEPSTAANMINGGLRLQRH